MSGFSANAGIDMLTGNLFIESPVFKKSSLVVTARRSFTDLFRSSLYKSLFNKISYDIENTGNTTAAFIEAGPEDSEYYFYDYTAKYTWRPNEKDVISLSTYQGYDGMEFEGISDRASSFEESDWGNSGSSFRWARKWSERFYHNLLFGFSGYHLNFMHSDSLSRIQLNPARTVNIVRELGMSNAVFDKVLTLNNQYKISAHNQLDFGFSINALETEFTDRYSYESNQTILSDTITREKASEMLSAVYIQNNFSKGRLSLFNVGLRLSDYKNKKFLEPRVSAAFTIDKKLSLKSSYGINNQFINRILLFDEGQTKFLWTLSDDKRLPVVSSRQMSLGMIWNPQPTLTLDAELYKMRSEGMIAVQNRAERAVLETI
jgi:ferric enterobactin receptor